MQENQKTIATLVSKMETTGGKQKHYPPLVSLYEYLGKAAGPVEGAKVYAVAQKLNEPVESTYVENVKYKGKVMLYRKEFLKMYFTVKGVLEAEPTLGDQQNYSL